MDDGNFDRVTRLFAKKASRREAIAILLAAGATFVTSLRVDAKKRCRAVGQSCRKGDECCSGVCAKPSKTGRSICAPEPKAVCDTFECGDFCCPPEAVACATPDTPGGQTITCKCAQGFEYVNGACVELTCSTESNCAGSVSCGPVNNDDLCCPFPLHSFCACKSPATGEPVVGCCTLGVDCPQDLGWHEYAWNHYVGPCVEDGIAICCCETKECEWAGTVSLTCEAS